MCVNINNCLCFPTLHDSYIWHGRAIFHFFIEPVFSKGTRDTMMAKTKYLCSVSILFSFRIIFLQEFESRVTGEKILTPTLSFINLR